MMPAGTTVAAARGADWSADAERPVGPDLDGLAFGTDLAGFLPVLADGGVGQPGVMRGHDR